MNLKRNIIFIIFIGVSVSLGLVIYLVPGIADVLTKTVTAEYGNFQVTDDADFYIVRDEMVYLSAGEGHINYYLEQNEMVRKGTTVLELIPASLGTSDQEKYNDLRIQLGNRVAIQGTYQSESSGILSYYVDGYEGIFNPQTMETLAYEDVVKFDIEQENLVREAAYSQEPIYKICKNDLWYLMTWVNRGDVSKYELGKDVIVYLPKGEIKAKVYNIIAEGERWKVILSTNRYYVDFVQRRKIGATVLTSDYKGIIIPNESIASIDEEIGVYVINKKSEKVFTPISIYATDGDDSCIAVEFYYNEEGNKINTVDIYDTLVRKAN